MSRNPFDQLEETEPQQEHQRPLQNIKNRINATIGSFNNGFKFLEFLNDFFAVIVNVLKSGHEDMTKNNGIINKPFLKDEDFNNHENDNQQPPDKSLDEDKKD